MGKTAMALMGTYLWKPETSMETDEAQKPSLKKVCATIQKMLPFFNN